MTETPQNVMGKNLLKILDKGKFWEYPPHNRPAGVCQIRTDYKNVYYQWISGSDIDWVLFNDDGKIEELCLYSLRKEEMQKISEENNNYLVFKMMPTCTGTSAYEKLEKDYPSNHWIANRFPSLRHLDENSFEKLDEFLKTLY